MYYAIYFSVYMFHPIVFFFQISILLYKNRLDTDDVSVHINKLSFLIENLDFKTYGSQFSWEDDLRIEIIV